MEWDIDNLDIIVNYINKELDHRAMIDIEINDFGVNQRVIHKRLLRKGYKRKDNKYIQAIEEYNKSITKGIPIKYNKCITKDIPVKKQEVEIIKDSNLINDIDIKSIKELVGLIEPIKEVIQKYNKSITSDNIINVEPIEIKIDRGILNNKINSVGFRIDIEVYEEWKRFTNEFKDIKNQDLLGMALIEYMKKYGNIGEM